MLFIHLYGTEKIVKQKSIAAAHRQENLKRWFLGGIVTPGIVILKLEARKIQYWLKQDEGEWSL